MSNKARGAARENKVAEELRADGWLVKGTGDAHGKVDLIALRGGEAKLVQVKGSRWSAYSDFSPAERETLGGEGAKAGFPVWLAWAPPDRKPTRWIPEEDWPRGKNRSAVG